MSRRVDVFFLEIGRRGGSSRLIVGVSFVGVKLTGAC